ncbi:MAG: cobalt transporter CbiM [Geminicoccaceae bacterium]
MAHIPDGLLSTPVLAGSAVLAVAGIGYAIRRLDPERLPHAAVLGAMLFVASLVHIPIGPTSVHLLLNGLAGLILGWTALPVIAVALTLQLVFFGFGGVTSLGVNIVTIGLPALVVAVAVGPLLTRARRPGPIFLLGIVAGVTGVLGSAALVCLVLATSSAEFRPVLGIVAATYLPLALVEGFVTGAAVALLRRIKPEVFAHAGLAGAHG